MIAAPLLIGALGLLLLGLSRSSASTAPSSITIHDGEQPPRPAPAPGAKSSEQAAAKALQAYLKSSSDFGSKAKPSARVKSLQKQMGSIAADGVVGDKTRARAKALGYTLPAAPAAKIQVVDHPPLLPSDQPPAPAPATPAKIPASRSFELKPSARYRAALELDGFDALATNAQVLAELQKKVGPWKSASVTGSGAKRTATGTYAGNKRTVKLPAEVKSITVLAAAPAPEPRLLPSDTPAPAPAAPSSSSSSSDAQRSAAKALQAYLASSHDFGSKAHPSAMVKSLQSKMGSIAADGVVGDKTRARAKALGYTLPAEPAAPKLVSAPKIVQPAPRPTPAPKALPAPKPAATAPRALPAPAPAPKSTPAVSPTDSAARALDAYVQSGGRDRNRIADQQWTLGLDADGIPGSTTIAALKQHGVAPKWNPISASQLSGGIPGGATPKSAAERLERYWNLPGSSHNADRLKAYQRVLGVKADGGMGPATRTAAEHALGRKPKL